MAPDTAKTLSRCMFGEMPRAVAVSEDSRSAIVFRPKPLRIKLRCTTYMQTRMVITVI